MPTQVLEVEGSSGQDLLVFNQTGKLEELEGSNINFVQTEYTYPGNDFTDSISEGQGLKKKRITPDQATTILYEKWKATLPLLVDELLAYTTASIGATIQPIGLDLEGVCCSLDVKITRVTCLYYDHMSHLFLLEDGEI